MAKRRGKPGMRMHTQLSMRMSLQQRFMLTTALLATSAFVLTALLYFSGPNAAYAAAYGDYRTKGSGYWMENDTWEKFDGIKWVAAEKFPTSDDGVIMIRSGHVVKVKDNITVDQCTIAEGASVANQAIFEVNDGVGTDLVVKGKILNEHKVFLLSEATVLFPNDTY